MESRRWWPSAVAVTAVLIGCGGASSPETAPGESVEASSPARAVELCQAALDQVSTTQEDRQHGLISEGCSPLFSLPMCREAVGLSPQAPPELRGPMIALACQQAYCGLLGEPAPAFCELDLPSTGRVEMKRSWGEFVTAVLALELGLELEAPLLATLSNGLEPLLAVAEQEVEAPETAPEAPRRALVVRFRTLSGGYQVGAQLGEMSFGPWELPLRPDQGDFEGLLEAAMRRAGGCPAALEIGADVEYELVVALMDALRAGGIEEMVLAVPEAPISP